VNTKCRYYVNRGLHLWI